MVEVFLKFDKKEFLSNFFLKRHSSLNILFLKSEGKKIWTKKFLDQKNNLVLSHSPGGGGGSVQKSSRTEWYQTCSHLGIF